MELHFGKGLIRSFRPDDAADMALLANNASIAMNLRDIFPHPYELADAEAFIALALTEEIETKFVLDVDGSPVGVISIQPQSDIHRGTGELGYWLGEPYWGQGIATSAVTVFSAWAMRHYSLRRVFALVSAENFRSRRVLEKAGFTLEGILREGAIKSDRIMDEAMYALLAADTHGTGKDASTPDAG